MAAAQDALPRTRLAVAMNARGWSQADVIRRLRHAAELRGRQLGRRPQRDVEFGYVYLTVVMRVVVFHKIRPCWKSLSRPPGMPNSSVVG